jgi:hypothetical protein
MYIAPLGLAIQAVGHILLTVSLSLFLGETRICFAQTKGKERFPQWKDSFIR